jgi:hypothetical protein
MTIALFASSLELQRLRRIGVRLGLTERIARNQIPLLAEPAGSSGSRRRT